jgi:hypothetical protein
MGYGGVDTGSHNQSMEIIIPTGHEIMVLA